MVNGLPASAAVLPGAVAAVLFTAGAAAGAGAFAGASPDGSCLPHAVNASANANRDQQRREVASANPLHVRGEISNVIGREAFGDGLHDAVGSGRPRAGSIVIQLLHDVGRLLTAQRRKFRRFIALARRAVAGHARRNAARLIAAAVQFLARLPVGGVRFQSRCWSSCRNTCPDPPCRPRVKLTVIGIMTGLARLPVLEIIELLGDVVGAESREAGPFRIRAVAIGAMTGLAGRSLGGAGFDAGRGKGRGRDKSAGNGCCKNPNPLHDALIPHFIVTRCQP